MSVNANSNQEIEEFKAVAIKFFRETPKLIDGDWCFYKTTDYLLNNLQVEHNGQWYYVTYLASKEPLFSVIKEGNYLSSIIVQTVDDDLNEIEVNQIIT